MRADLFDQDLSRELNALAKRRLQENNDLKPLAAVEARWIVEHALEASPDGEAARALAQTMVTRRLTGEPLSRIFGEAEFYGLPMGVTAETLDPRNDTEALVNLVLDHQGDDTALRFLDLGTGTGCIAIALLSQRALWHGVAVDVSAAALAQAQKNRDNPTLEPFGLRERLGFVHSDWFTELTGGDGDEEERFDLIVSNPPYLTAQDMDQLDASVKGFDPDLALYGGNDGLEAYRIILGRGRDFLAPCGMVGLEIGWQQKNQVIEIAMENEFEIVEKRQDLAKRDRALLFQRVN